MKKFYLTTFLIVSTLLVSCSHTNQLSKYKVAGSAVIFRTSTKERGTAVSAIATPSNGIGSIIVSAVGSGISSEMAQKKLNNAVKPDSIASQIGKGIRTAMMDYLNVKPVDNMEQNPDYIVETVLTSYQIISSEAGLSACARGKSRVIHRASGKIVWEDSETHNFNISDSWLAVIAPQPVKTGVSVVNAVKLNSMSEEELNTVISKTAFEVGREIGETMREDIAELNQR